MRPILWIALAAGSMLFVYGLRVLSPALTLIGIVMGAVSLSLAFAETDFGGED